MEPENHKPLDPATSQLSSKDSPSLNEPVVGEVAIFRITDILFSINQACAETVVQLRISHLYQLQKERKSLLEKLFLVIIAAATIIPTLDHLFPKSNLRWIWISSVIAFLFVLYLLEKDRLFKKTHEDYESSASFDRIVKQNQVELMSDYVSSYATRHDMVYTAYQDADDFVKESLRGILGSYHRVFVRTRQKLTDLMSQKPPQLDPETYNSLIGYIDFCENRYRNLDHPAQEE